MKEAVRQVKNGWLVAIAIGVIAVAYFSLLGTANFEDPGENLEYNLAGFEDLDKVPSAYEELTAIAPGVENPRALATGTDKWYLAATDAVIVYGADDKELARYPIPGTPSCIGVAEDGTLYVGLEKKLVVLGPDGKAAGEWKDFTDRSFLTAIAIKGDDVFVADAGKRVVLRFDRSGKLLNRIGEKDPVRDVPGLEAPSPYLDLAINGDGDLWVVNPGKLGLEQYRPDGSIVTSWYKPSVLKLDGFPGCCNPTHIAFNREGSLLTCEKGLVRLKEYEVTAGEFEGLVAGSAAFPREQSMRDLVVDAKDRVLVLDGQRKSVRVFARKELAHATANQHPS